MEIDHTGLTEARSQHDSSEVTVECSRCSGSESDSLTRSAASESPVARGRAQHRIVAASAAIHGGFGWAAVLGRCLSSESIPGKSNLASG